MAAQVSPDGQMPVQTAPPDLDYLHIAGQLEIASGRVGPDSHVGQRGCGRREREQVPPHAGRIAGGGPQIEGNYSRRHLSAHSG